jgi:ABC-type multidrug transport system ATPase subunit
MKSFRPDSPAFLLNSPYVKMPTTSPVIARITNLTFAYPGQTVFDHYAMAIHSGLTLIKADEGRGKTSLAKLLAGEIHAHSGQIQIKDNVLPSDSWKSICFYIDPQTQVYDQVSVNAFIQQLVLRFPKAQISHFKEIAEGLSLSDHLDKKLYMLSTGTRRKVFLAGALVAQAELTLLDVPFSAMDLASIRFAKKTLNETFADNAHCACVIFDYEAHADLAVSHLIDWDKSVG